MDWSTSVNEWTASLVSLTFLMHLMNLYVRRAAIFAVLSLVSEDIVSPSLGWELSWPGRGLAMLLAVIAVEVTYKSPEASSCLAGEDSGAVLIL